MRFLSRRELTMFILSVSVASVIAVLITVIVMLSRGYGRKPEQKGPSISIGKETERPPLSDFLIPEDYSQVIPAESSYVLSRRPGRPWSEEEVHTYWIPPEDILAETRKANEALIDELFEEVP